MTRVPFIAGKPSRRWFIRDAMFRHDHERGSDYQLTFPVAFWINRELLEWKAPISRIYAPVLIDSVGDRTLYAWRGTGWAFRLWWRRR